MKKFELNKNWSFKIVYPTISAYLTTYNCVNGKYPFEEAIKSFSWVDELVVVDGGSTDGTREKLTQLTEQFSNLSVYDIAIDPEDPLKDGNLKSMARAMCTSQYLIQFDSDELCLGDVLKWKTLVKEFADNEEILQLLVIEPFGSLTNVRINESHNNLKWRISKNLPHITHSAPDYDRVEKNGKVYSRGKSDGTFPCHIVTNKLLNSYALPQEIEASIAKNEKNVSGYIKILTGYLTTNQPCILHVGHVNLENKLKLYVNSWMDWWCCLYNLDCNDSANNQYFPGIKREEITDSLISQKVVELISQTPSVQLSQLSEFAQYLTVR